MSGSHGSIAGLLVVLLAAGAGGCGGAAKQNASGAEASVRSVLTRFEEARSTGNPDGVCGHLVAVEERGRIEVEREGEHAGSENGSCESAFQQATESRRDLRSYAERLQRVTVRGDKARAEGRVRVVRADGSVLSRPVVYELIRRDGWRLILHAE